MGSLSIRGSIFNFDKVSLKGEVILVVNIFNVRIILVEANGTRSHLYLSNSPFYIMKFSRFSQDFMQRTQGGSNEYPQSMF